MTTNSASVAFTALQTSLVRSIPGPPLCSRQPNTTTWLSCKTFPSPGLIELWHSSKWCDTAIPPPYKAAAHHRRPIATVLKPARPHVSHSDRDEREDQGRTMNR
eukprot:6193816-Pleurochrysis_carterae.AAC.1